MCPKLIELLSWNGPTVHVCCFMLARASTKTFFNRVQKTAKKSSLAEKFVIRVTRYPRYHCTLYSTNKYSFVRPVHTLYIGYFIEHDGMTNLVITYSKTHDHLGPLDKQTSSNIIHSFINNQNYWSPRQCCQESGPSLRFTENLSLDADGLVQMARKKRYPYLFDNGVGYNTAEMVGPPKKTLVNWQY